jgi:hypothetical protein
MEDLVTGQLPAGNLGGAERGLDRGGFIDGEAG